MKEGLSAAVARTIAFAPANPEPCFGGKSSQDTVTFPALSMSLIFIFAAP
jgi:hypothetical protein